jgi:hypothetical protein
LLIREQFQFVGIYLESGMLINQPERQDKPQAALLAHKSPLYTLQQAALDSNPFAYQEISVRLEPATIKIGTEEFDF